MSSISQTPPLAKNMSVEGVTNDSPRSIAELGVAEVHRAHADFVWATLHRLGVSAGDVPDVFQEVFVTVHQRLHTFDGRAKITSWLFGICLRKTAAWRRKAHRRRERLVAAPPEERADGTPESDLAKRRARATLHRLLDSLAPERRVVFVMFELEGLSTQCIADTLGLPQGTVSSRLGKARQEFQAALRRHRARERGARGGS